jgi:hypothetical protein
MTPMIALCSRDGCSFLCLLLLALVLRIDGYFEPIFIAYEKGKREWQRKKTKEDRWWDTRTKACFALLVERIMERVASLTVYYRWALIFT